MANYKSQYTGEQIDEAIGKVLNAPNIYNYDGTVIIEKAESVLGLRRFKETINSTGLSLFATDEDSTPYLQDSANYIPIKATLNGEVTNRYLLPFYSQSDENSDDIALIIWLFPEPTFSGSMMEIYKSINTDIETNELSVLGDFEVLGSSNNDEWLLANTEGVSV